MAPASTISTMPMVSPSVMRRPSAKRDSTPRRFSIAPICGPPPCTTTGLTPDCSSSTMSREKSRAT
jgi:hypothetical protein